MVINSDVILKSPPTNARIVEKSCRLALVSLVVIRSHPTLIGSFRLDC